MKRAVIIVAVLLSFILAHPASAMYSRLTTAQSLNQGEMESGISVGRGDDGDYNYSYSYLYPYLRYGLGYLLEIEGKLGVLSIDKDSGDDDIGILGGIELKYQIIKETQKIPVDVAISGGYTGHVIESQSLHELDFAGLISKTFDIDKFKLTPFGGPEITYTNGSYISEGKADIFLILGADLRFTESLALGAEIKFGSDWATGLGLKIKF